MTAQNFPLTSCANNMSSPGSSRSTISRISVVPTSRVPAWKRGRTCTKESWRTAHLSLPASITLCMSPMTEARQTFVSLYMSKASCCLIARHSSLLLNPFWPVCRRPRRLRNPQLGRGVPLVPSRTCSKLRISVSASAASLSLAQR